MANETEYQFNDAEDVEFEPEVEADESAEVEQPESSEQQEYAQPTASAGKFKAAPVKQKIVFIIAILVVIFAVYKFGSFILSPKKATPALPSITANGTPATAPAVAKSTIPIMNATAQTPAQSAQQKTATTTPGAASSVPASLLALTDQSKSTTTTAKGTTTAAAPATALPGKTAAEMPTAQPAEEQASLVDVTQALHDSTQAMQGQLSDNQKSLSVLQEQISSLTSAIDEMQSKLANVSQHVQKTDALEKQLAAYRKELGKLTAQRVRMKKQYFVQAVVPGRAWLRGADGTTETVAVGDMLVGYGKVTSIDPYSGTVQTSSGIKMLYGIDDN